MIEPLIALLTGGYRNAVIAVILLVVALSLHEFAHATAARALGDPTARLAGRLTLNPRVHFDPFGVVSMAIFGFGWGKAVPVSASKLKTRRFGVQIVAVAGPLMNLAQAVAFAILRLTLAPSPFLAVLFEYGVVLNVFLALFNLLPIPPLDGMPILAAALPASRRHVLEVLERWSFVILIIAVIVARRVLTDVALPLADVIFRIVSRFA